MKKIFYCLFLVCIPLFALNRPVVKLFLKGDEVFSQKSIPVIDLYGFTRQLGNEQFIDHVHYSDKASDLQAAFIAGFLQSYIKSNLF